MLARWGFMLVEVCFDVYESQFQLTKSLELKFKINITKIWVFKSQTTLFTRDTRPQCIVWIGLKPFENFTLSLMENLCLNDAAKVWKSKICTS